MQDYDDGYSDGRRDAYDEGHSDGYDDGYSDGFSDGCEAGYEDGYDEGYNDSYGEWYDEGYTDGSIEGYGQGFADALRGYEYAFTPDSDFVLVPEGTSTFHKFDCDEIVGDEKSSWYWIEEALVLGYQYCKDCIGK